MKVILCILKGPIYNIEHALLRDADEVAFWIYWPGQMQAPFWDSM